MKINDSKRRRMYIMQQIANRQSSVERMSNLSRQKRRIIEDNLNQFHKTMSNISLNKTGDSKYFVLPPNHMQSSFNSSSFKDKKQQIKGQYDGVLRSPSFKDINVEKQSQFDKHPQIQTQRKQNQNLLNDKLKQEKMIVKEQDERVQDEQIKYNIDGQRQKLSGQEVNNAFNSISENNSSTAGIFFTSQFNQFLNKNHQDRQNVQIPHLDQKKQTQSQQDQSQKLQQNVMIEEKQELKQTNQIKNHKQNDEINHFPDTIDEQDNKKLIKNKSGYSLALSNQSSLKYSLYQSNIKQILNRKVINQLIVQPHQFLPNEDEPILPFIKLQILTDKILAFQQKKYIKSLLQFFKIHLLSLKILKCQKKKYFNAFIINKELNFQQKKNQIKCNNYLRQKNTHIISQIFKYLQSQYFEKPRFNLEKAQNFSQKVRLEKKQTIYRNFKISWFDQKVKKQIDLYYLSRLLSHFKRVVNSEKLIARNKSLSYYCHNLKKRYFGHIIQGVNNMQMQRIQRDNASWHYAFGFQRKVFDAWKQKFSYKDRYISLAMTTKNTFKQTSDQKWLQIKTVDFKQIK